MSSTERVGACGRGKIRCILPGKIPWIHRDISEIPQYIDVYLSHYPNIDLYTSSYYITSYVFINIFIHLSKPSHTYTRLHIHSYPLIYIIHLHIPSYSNIPQSNILIKIQYKFIHLHIPSYNYILLTTTSYIFIHLHLPSYLQIYLHPPLYTFIHVHIPSYSFINLPKPSKSFIILHTPLHIFIRLH